MLRVVSMDNAKRPYEAEDYRSLAGKRILFSSGGTA